jgi:hypothetical protein
LHMRFLGATALAVALIAGPAVGLPSARASDGLFLDEVRTNVQVPLTDAQALQLGHAACDAMHAGLARGLSLGQARRRSGCEVAPESLRYSVHGSAPISVDLEATRRRRQRLKRYVESHLLASGRFICPHYMSCCVSRRPTDSFYEGR